MILDIYDQLAADVRQLPKRGAFYTTDGLIQLVIKYQELPDEDLSDETGLSVDRFKWIRRSAGLSPYKSSSKATTQAEIVAQIKAMKVINRRHLAEKYGLSIRTTERLIRQAGRSRPIQRKAVVQS